MLTRAVGAVLLVLLLAVPVSAQKWGKFGKIDEAAKAPAMSLMGPTGVILTPNADVLGPPSRWAVGYHHMEREVTVMREYEADLDFDLPKVNFGIGDSVEVGATFVLVDTPFDDEDDTVIHAKWRLLDDLDDDLRFAVGVWDIFDQIETRWYVVASKGFGENRRVADLSVGYMFGDDDPHGYRQIVGDSVFASVTWHALSCLDVMGEVTEDDFNYGLRWWPMEEVNIDGFIMDGGDWAVGVAYTGEF
jgi:hypothetical protein